MRPQFDTDGQPAPGNGDLRQQAEQGGRQRLEADGEQDGDDDDGANAKAAGRLDKRAEAKHQQQHLQVAVGTQVGNAPCQRIHAARRALQLVEQQRGKQHGQYRQGGGEALGQRQQQGRRSQAKGGDE